MTKMLGLIILSSLAYFNFQGTAKPTSDCADFKNGIFLFKPAEDTAIYIVERNDSIQKETNYFTKDNIIL